MKWERLRDVRPKPDAKGRWLLPRQGRLDEAAGDPVPNHRRHPLDPFLWGKTKRELEVGHLVPTAFNDLEVCYYSETVLNREILRPKKEKGLGQCAEPRGESKPAFLPLGSPMFYDYWGASCQEHPGASITAALQSLSERP